MKDQDAEQSFRKFCAQAGIRWRKVPTDDKKKREKREKGEQRPDCEIWASGHKIVVEVKQFCPTNREEKEALEDSENKSVAAFPIHKPGERVRNAMGTAASQLKALSKGKIPAMLVLQNNIGALHTHPYAILTAMRGLDRIPVAVPDDPNISPSFGNVESGSRRKMTEKHNTKISAIAVIQISSDEMYELDVYHNRFAANPIDPTWLQQPRIRHWKIPEGSTSSLAGWEPL